VAADLRCERCGFTVTFKGEGKPDLMADLAMRYELGVHICRLHRKRRRSASTVKRGRKAKPR
jgi:hypothetical protein